MTVHELSRTDARRIAVRAQLLDGSRRGNDRLWDLATRVYPDDPVVPAGEALRIRNERRLRALGIARARGPECAVEAEARTPATSAPFPEARHFRHLRTAPVKSVAITQTTRFMKSPI